MDNRKRARLEVSVGASSIDAGIGVGGADLSTTATGIAGAQSIFLSSAATTASNSADAVGMLPANVFLTICGDENSDESQDYLAIDGNTLAHIKQEQELLAVGNSIINGNSSSSTQATQTLPLQYRIVNQLQRQLPAHIDTINNNDSNCALNSTLSPMQLPSGCEIYLIKEYVDNIPQMLTEDSELLQNTPSTTTIKVEPDSCATLASPGVSNAAAARVGIVTGGGSGGANNNSGGNGDSVQVVRNTLPCMLTAKLATANTTPLITTAATTTTASSVISTSSGDVNNTNGLGVGGAKRSYILEAYKKRDDKRRATHNEVERRRRDKINNWIFKLKEMLPTDMAQHNNNNNSSSSNNITNSQINNAATSNTNGNIAVNSESQRVAIINNANNSNNTNSRPPPSDSKSQILIKACEYIKAMQDEIKSLRECLTENERLRLSNQRLQNELNKLRNEHQCGVSPFNSNKTFNNNFNITLNSLNSNSNSDVCGSNSNSNSPGGVNFCASGSLIASNATRAAAFTKRELIIRDYVD